MGQKTSWSGAALTEADINLYLSGEGGAWTSWTPAIVQSGSVTCTVTRAKYARYGRTIHFMYQLAVTGSGTGSNAITVSLPVTAAASGFVIGGGSLFDTSSSNIYQFLLYGSSTAVCQLWTSSTDGTGVALGQSVFTAALASGDSINASGTYEAAS
jgi:hypothetical protein